MRERETGGGREREERGLFHSCTCIHNNYSPTNISKTMIYLLEMYTVYMYYSTPNFKACNIMILYMCTLLL